ncbi:hypothetical protein [Aurantiacibacter poecillastricola]|uniref:hypothetical protein n=1 Tax=Aurantiacibacter poecillastricola TaxID=3064385 RepID=UPI00273EFACA|nr:hypothetical protein [Aurantiacibacter sp. 219JJ12-13]MDP5263455.1 hypothetical protein [Aurantiacibacter sp. 219JJ12-13]
MIRPLLLLLLPVLLALPACGDRAAGDSEPVAGSGSQGAPDVPLPGAPPSAHTSADEPNDVHPSLAPPVLDAEAAGGETGARSVLVNWARALELEEYDQAWSMLGEQDKQRWNREEFAALFEDLSEITVAVPSGRMEGAAGSLYYTAPTTITATDADGRPVRYEGEVVLRRVNDVPGATAEQLQWHIERVSLDWTH